MSPRPAGPPARGRADVLVGALLAALVTALYLPYALRAGWYYDDWSLYARMQDAGTSFGAHFHACRVELDGNRAGACLYHAAEYSLLGAHRWAYHVWMMIFLLALALLGYRILRWCGLARTWAALTASLLIVFPAADATRLWPVAAVAQYVLVLQAAAVLLALNGLAPRPRAQHVALHIASVALSLVALASYEIVIPLVALSGLVYLAAYRSRRVLWRGALDLGLALAFVAFRMLVDPPSQSSGFVVHRDLSGDVDRARTLLHGAWGSWSAVFAVNGRNALLGVAAVLAASATAAALDPALRRRLLPWAALLAGAAITAFLCALVFITANDFYVPVIGGTFNRLNAPGALASCTAFVALLGLTYELAQRLVPIRGAAAALVVAIVAAAGWHQLGISSEHKRAWEDSWRVQSHALAGYRRALAEAPRDASIVGFDTPIWEHGYVPVFAASWDLRGALDYTTGHDPALATPLTGGVVCGPDAVLIDGAPQMPYRGAAPLYFVSPMRQTAVRIVSRAACEARIARWGRPPLGA